MTDTLKALLAESEKKCKALTIENDGLAAELETVRGQAESAEFRLTHALKDLATERAAHAQTQAELDRNIAALTRTWTELAMAKSQRDDNENAWQCEKQKREETEAQRDECAAAGDANFARAEEAEKERDEAQAEIQQLKHELRQLPAERLGMNIAIARAHIIFGQALNAELVWSKKLQDEVKDWMESPVVQLALKAAP